MVHTSRRVRVHRLLQPQLAQVLQVRVLAGELQELRRGRQQRERGPRRGDVAVHRRQSVGWWHRSVQRLGLVAQQRSQAAQQDREALGRVQHADDVEGQRVLHNGDAPHEAHRTPEEGGEQGRLRRDREHVAVLHCATVCGRGEAQRNRRRKLHERREASLRHCDPQETRDAFGAHEELRHGHAGAMARRRKAACAGTYTRTRTCTSTSTW